MGRVIDILDGYGRNPYFVRARRRYARLSDDQRAEIDAGFVRHLRACKKHEIDPDPAWIAEAVEDALKDSGDLGRRL